METWQHVTFISGHLRDGRKIKREAKVKHAMAMERFLARSSGFANKSDATLDELGLGWLAPSHSHRPDTSCT